LQAKKNFIRQGPEVGQIFVAFLNCVILIPGRERERENNKQEKKTADLVQQKV
jgi:hypothetical protein